jgi:hypothetical protein
MPYDYLNDGTPFTAEALNSRLEAEKSNVNQVAASEVKLGALGYQHLPTLVDISGKSVSSILSDERNTLEFNYSEFDGHLDNDHLKEITLDTPITSENCSAVIVLANIAVNKFTYNGNDLTKLSFPTEDIAHAVFTVQYRGLGASAWYDVASSARSISPGLTMLDGSISSPIIPFPGSQIIYDDRMSNKDVAIRTVIREIPVGGIHAIRVKVATYQWIKGNPFEWKYQLQLSKYNITAIPIHTQVTES